MVQKGNHEKYDLDLRVAVVRVVRSARLGAGHVGAANEYD